MLRSFKEKIKKIVFLLLFILSSNALSQNLYFYDAIQLIDENGHIEIPDFYSYIDEDAFQNLNLQSVSLPDNISSIGSYTFANTSITSIELPESLTSIGHHAFYGSKIKSIVIPSNVTVINESTFENSDLEQITIPSNINEINRNAFLNSKLTSINLANVQSIGFRAFMDTPLQVVSFPETLTTIGDDAFRNTLITDLTIPDSVVSIGREAFRNVPLKTLSFGSGITSPQQVKSGAFHNSCKTLEALSSGSILGFDDNTSAGETNINPDNSSYSRRLKPGIYFTTDESDKCPRLKHIVLWGEASQLFDISYGLSIDNEYTTVLSIETDSLSSRYGRYSFGIVDKIVFTQAMNFPNDIFRPDAHALLCDPIDSDGDNVLDCADAFPNNSDAWSDSNEDGIEDNYENVLEDDSTRDSDFDGILDIFDPQPFNRPGEGCDSSSYSEQDFDTDSDGIKNCWDGDDDNDGLIDAFEPIFGTNSLIPDSDYDGVLDGLDAFPLDNTESLDTDSDGIGNNADTDDDNDGYTDFLDAFPTDATEWADSDLDGIGNNSDPDDDNDGVADTEDAFPNTASESLDSDNDGVGDNADAFPNDATEVADTDLDGIGNNADPDDDNDGVADADDGDPLNADIGIQPSQLISVAGNPVGVNGHSTRISISYDTSDGDNQLPGIGFRVHYSSEMLTFVGTESVIGHDLIVNGDGPYQDDSDLDNNADTDKFILFGWASLNGNWPNVNLPASLVDVVFDVNWDTPDQASINTPINFSKVDTTEGYNFEATNYALNVLPATWDFDGNGQADALTDGLILLRHAFGVRGATLTNGVMAQDATLTTDKVELAVEKAAIISDVDGNGEVNALTDALVVLRYMFGIRDELLVERVISPDATRTSPNEIEEHIELYMP